MQRVIFSLTCTLLWTASASCQEFNAVLSSDEFRPGKEITLTIQGGKTPFTFGFGSSFFRGERLLLQLKQINERTYRVSVSEELNPADTTFRTITIEDDEGRETIARTAPAAQPPRSDDALARLIENLQSSNEAVRLHAAKKLGNMGVAARPALAALQRLVNDPDEDVRLIAATAIRRIQATGPSPTSSDHIKALIQQLQSPEDFDRLFALRALAKLGAEAKDAIPFVEKLANEGTPQERGFARTVLDTLRRAAPPVDVDSRDIFSILSELTSADERDTGRPDTYRKVFSRQLVGGGIYVIDLSSKDFDSYLRLEDNQGQELAKNDDGGGYPNARIVFPVPRDGLYRIIATTFGLDATGKFTLTVRPARQVMNIVDRLTANDPKDRVRTDSVCKVHELQMSAGRHYVIDMVSDDFDSYLRLEDDQGTQLAFDDDTGGFPHARINFQAPRDGSYRIIATSYAKDALGRYTLKVCEVTTPLSVSP